MIIHSVPSPAGAGKTFALVDHAATLADRGEKVLISQPSKALVSQTAADFRVKFPDIKVTVIVSADAARDSQQGVVDRIIEHTRTAKAGVGEVLIVTHRGFELARSMYLDRPHQWHLFEDEIRAAHWSGTLALAEHREVVEALFAVEPHNAAYSRVIAAPGAAAKLKRIVANANGDQFWMTLQDLAERIVAPHWDVYVDASHWAAFLAGDDVRADLQAILLPDLYAGMNSVTIMGAEFHDSLLATLWRSRYRMPFPERREIVDRLRYTAHPNGYRLRILYAGEEAWSKRHRDVKTKDGESVLDAVTRRTVEALPDGCILWQANKDIDDRHFEALAPGRAIRLPFVSHGLNCYQAHDNVVVLSATNPPPAAFNFLADHDIDGDAVRTALYRQTVYQALCRSSLRDLECTREVTAVVMDRGTAEWTAAMFDGAKVEALPGIEAMPRKGAAGRPRKHVDDADRMAKTRLDTFQRLETHLDVLTGKLRLDDMVDETYRAKIRNDLGAFTTTSMGDISGLAGTLYEDKFSKRPFGYQPMTTVDEFVTALHDQWLGNVGAKEGAGLISPAIFDPGASTETQRGYPNIVAIRHIWIDIDDGSDLTPDEFARIFANMRMVICNSYSSAAEQPRYRVMIPTSCPMSRDVHAAIIRDMLSRLNRRGYYSAKQIADRVAKGKEPGRRHGIDMGKTVPTSLFYLPAQPRDPAGAYWRDYNDAGRAVLDPYRIIKAPISREEEAPAPPPPLPAPIVIPEGAPDWKRRMLEAKRARGEVARQERVDAAVQKWQAAALQNGVGNVAFFAFAAALKRCGLEQHEARHLLHLEAGHARHPEERRREIGAVIKRLWT